MNSTNMIIIGIGILVSLFVWSGMKVSPKSFSSYPEKSADCKTIPLPEGLPAPVERFYREVYGDEIPVIESFILTGRGNLRFMGITFPARLRFIHDAGRGYRHYIETSFWGLPVLRVNEHFLNWKSRLVLPFGVVENEPQVDQAASLGMWSETMMFPCVYLSTNGVRWEEIDETTARLVVPFKEEEDAFTVEFDEESGLIDRMEALRWKHAGNTQKTCWQAQVKEWGLISGWQMPVLFAAQWMDEDTPWLMARIEAVTWNVNVSEYIHAQGQ